MQTQTHPSADIWQGLMAAREITKTVNVSRSQWHSLVKKGKAPQPALRLPPRYTRWLARDIQKWLESPGTWSQSKVAE